ncbi:MAG: PEP-CTERM sorting domain-containing protein [Kiritimatiellae bacterium]|jgi:hypothetical protein|nr:PEP-CTERM sorting domain-containing protein [Kiritimatiellia bacterium]
MRHTIIPLAIAGCLSLATGYSELLLTEDFESLTTGDLNGQNGWSAITAVDVAAGGLGYSNGSMVIDGGTKHATWTGANAQGIASKAFASQSEEVWFSFTVNVVTTDTANRFWFTVSDDADLGNSGVMGQINSNSGALLSGYRAGSTQITSAGTPIPTETFLLVGRFSKDGISSSITDYDRMEMWVNPDSATLGTGSNYYDATDATGSGISSGIDTFAISSLGTGATEVQWDNLRIGTTQGDVVIPEPSTLLLVTIAGLLGVVGLRRKGRSARR